MLDGLVGGAVLAEADGVVGHHEDGARMRQRRHSDRRAHVVCRQTVPRQHLAMSAFCQVSIYQVVNYHIKGLLLILVQESYQW